MPVAVGRDGISMIHPNLIDPELVTHFNRSPRELLVFWLFALFVRGKSANVQAQKLYKFIEREDCLDGDVYNLTLIGQRKIDDLLRRVKAGQYVTLSRAIDETMLCLQRYPFYLRHATVAELEEISGVGPKTARFFVMHSRRDANVAALDVHILRFIDLSTDIPVPTTTPTGKKYAELEKIFLDIATLEGVKPADMDLAIWRASRKKEPLKWRDYL